MLPEDCLQVAARIGQRLARRALWQGTACTWDVWRSQGDSAAAVPAASEIYQGTSGIALFLAELYRLTGEPAIAHTAGGAMAHALGCAAELPPAHFGLYSGRVGIVVAAARLGEVLQRPDFIDEARRLLAGLAGLEPQDEGLDVLAGGAGAILALLHLAPAVAGERPLEIARGLGDNLLRTAHREPRGWSWPVFPKSTVRHLTGFSHGAAGIALALLELALATGDGRYRCAAEMAFLYERQFFDAQRENWLDLRHTALSELGRHGDAAVRQAAIGRSIEPWAPSYMAAWCHGSPGIGLARLRAYELTGQAIYEEEAASALRSTLDWLSRPDRSADFSLCHGIAGLCELPMAAAGVLDQPALREICEWQGALGWETFERRHQPWPCGTMGQKNDPSLMVGEAGIGYFYLRLAASDVPSILCPRPLPVGEPALGEPQAGDLGEGYDDLLQETVEEFFATTLQALETLACEAEARCAVARPAIVEAPVEAAYHELRRRIDRHRGPAEAMLQDAFAIDRARYEMTLELSDFTAEYLGNLTRPEWRQSMVRSARFRLAEHCRLVTTERDWGAWLAARRAGLAEDGTADVEVTQLLYARGNRIRVAEVGPLAEAILEALPATFEQICDRVAELTEDADRMLDRALASLVEDQLEQLYAAGFIDDEAVPGREAAPARAGVPQATPQGGEGVRSGPATVRS